LWYLNLIANMVEAKTPETCQRRIEKVIDMIAAGIKTPRTT